MLIGNGMLAKGLKAFEGDQEILIFASGVSNSKETDRNEFQREFELLKENIEKYPQLKLIYFSTCSIFDKSLVGTGYIEHKMHMEKYIAEKSSNYVIFRLPNVIGSTTNPNTFFNFFKSKILSGTSIQIQEAATRYLIDMRDISKIIPLIIRDESIRNTEINVAFQNQMLIADIIDLYEDILNTKANKSMVSGGSAYVIDNEAFFNFLKKNQVPQPTNYNYQILHYYLKDSDLDIKYSKTLNQ